MMGDPLSPGDLGKLKKMFQHLGLGDAHAAGQVVADLPAARYQQVFDFVALGYDRERLVTLSATDELTLCLRGWLHYYGDDYEMGGRLFAQAWQAGGEWSAWAALGMGKVCSDLGHWHDAREWLLAALALARQECDLYRLAQCYGALGEVLFRAGWYKQAFEMFCMDASLLPPGSSHRSQLENYTAVCLGQLGHAQHAEYRLWGSLYAALDTDPHSAAFSLTSLFVLSCRKRDRELYQRLLGVQREHELEAAEMQGGFIAMAGAFWAWQAGEVANVSSYLEEAIGCFDRLYPIERVWAEALRAAVHRRHYDWLDLVQLQARQWPAYGAIGQVPVAAIDEHISRIPLAVTEPPFARLRTASVDELWGCMDLFFI